MEKIKKSEIENFLNRGSWEKVSRKEAPIEGRRIILYKLESKFKHKLNDTIRYKTRLCVKGFHQVPGMDYTSSFSPVASSSEISIPLSTMLKIKDDHVECLI